MATIEADVLDRMAEVHQQGRSRIQIAAEAAAMSLWFRLAPDPNSDSDMAEWAAQFYIVTRAASQAISSLTADYLSMTNAYLGIGAALPRPNLDWFRDDYRGWAMSPFNMYRDLTDEGLDGLDVDANVAAHISKLTSAVTRNSEQEALEQVLGSLEWTTTWEFVEERPDGAMIANTIDGVEALVKEAAEMGYPTTKDTGSALAWKRVPQAGSCGWCRVVADKAYTDAGMRSNQAWHTFCRCSWRKMTPDEARAFTPDLASGEWRDVIDERADTGESDA